MNTKTGGVNDSTLHAQVWVSPTTSVVANTLCSFDGAVAYVLKNEDGLVDNPHDPGGITNYGISLRFLKSIKPDASDDDIRNLSEDDAKEIYFHHFFEQAAFAAITNQNVANYMFDMAINHGIATAIKLTQRALWACYIKVHYVTDDGILGEQTLQAINEVGGMLIYPLMAERAGYVRMLAATNLSTEAFLNGWLNRCYRGGSL